MNILHATILGVIEGLTEFLPISSTAHLIVAEHIMGLANSEFLKSFTIIIQLGAVCAVLVQSGRMLVTNQKMRNLVFIAFVPTAVVGFLLYKLTKTYLIGDAHLALWILAIGGIVLILFERWRKDRALVVSDITMAKSFWIGMVQAIAIVPGVSRSGATIVAGLILGLSRQMAVEFSFLLALPTIMAATGYDIVKNYQQFSFQNFGLLSVGFVVSFIFGWLGISFLRRVSRAGSLEGFGWYRLIVAAAILLFI